MATRLLAISLASAVVAAAAQPNEGSDDRLGRSEIVSLSSPNCTLSSARRLEFERAAREYRSLRGECIAVRGWWQGNMIHASVMAARSAAPYRAPVQPVLGLYGTDPAVGPGPSEPVPVTAAGIAGACEVLDAGAGYCHSVSEGGILILGEIRPANLHRR